MPEATPQTPPRPPGYAATARAALNAGLLAGFLLGLWDGVVAGLRTDLTGAWNWIGCLGGTVLTYGVFWIVVLLAISPVAHALLRGRTRAERLRVLSALALGVGVFFELFWWSRDYLFSGLSATDPRRLAASAVMLVLGLAAGSGLVRLGRRLGNGTLWAGAALVPLLWLAGGVYLLNASSTAAERGRPNPRNRDLPNVLLFVVDALRADVLGCYGNERVKTPVLDDLAARGVLFENAQVQAPFTWSSFGSILTGKYPRRHGLVKMAPGVRMSPNITLPWHLKSAHREHQHEDDSRALRDGDFYGATFMTGTLSHGSGLLRGFDTYFEAMVGHDLVDSENPWSVFRSELVLSLLKTKLTGKLLMSRNVDPVADQAVRWFKKNGDKRFVSMVHFYSTHTPYDPAPRFREMYVDPEYDGPIDAFYAEYRIAIESGEYVPTEADKQQIANLYYGGVSQADAMIGEVLAELERQGTLDDTLVIVTSDHGEELGDHDLWEHNFMYETNLRVPLIVSWPRELPQGMRVDALVQTVDIVPTVCALMGVEPPYEEGQKDELGRDRGAIDGVDLGPLLRGEVDEVHRYAFAENGAYMSVRDRTTKLIVPWKALDEEGWAAMMAGEGERAQFYDLARDPDEHVNLLDERPEDVARLLEVLRRWDAGMPVPRNDVVLSARDLEAQRQRMRELGYADGVGQGMEYEQEGDPDGEREDP